MNPSSIVVTGIGLFTPLGDTIPAVSEAFAENRTAIKPLTRQDWSSMPVCHGGEIDLQNLTPYDLDPIKLKGFKHYVHFGIAATRNALTMARLLPGERDIPDNRLGAFVSSGINGENVEGLFEGLSLSTTEDGQFDPAQFAAKGMETVHPKWILTAISNNLIFFLTQEFKLCGDNNNSTYSTLGGVQMLDSACRAIRCGACDAAVVTGSDSLLNWQVADDLTKAGLLACDPATTQMNCYGENPRGALPAEGAACLILERKDRAIRRGATILAELLAVHESTDCVDPGDPLTPGQALPRTLDGLIQHLPETAGKVVLSLDGSAVPQWDHADQAGVTPYVSQWKKEGRLVHVAAVRPWFGHTFSAAFILDCVINIAALGGQLQLSLPHRPAENNTLFESPTSLPECSLVVTRCLHGQTGGALFLGNEAS